jgi:predicted Zn-dependent protease
LRPSDSKLYLSPSFVRSNLDQPEIHGVCVVGMVLVCGQRDADLMFRVAACSVTFSLLALAQQGGQYPHSAAEEQALGAAVAKQIRERTEPLENPSLQRHISDLGASLRNEPSQRLTFEIIKDPWGGATHEPVAIPGGYIFVPEALLQATHSEAELAGMLAHAISHLNQRQKIVAPDARIPMIYFGAWNAANILPKALRQELRSDELSADNAAVRILHAAGYDPAALWNYLARILPRNSSRLSTDRLANLQEAIDQLR